MSENRMHHQYQYRNRATRDPIDFDELIGASSEAKEQFQTATHALEASALVREMRQKADGGHPIQQKELARRLKVSPARVSAIESGDGPAGPTFALLRRIAHACGVGLNISIVPLHGAAADYCANIEEVAAAVACE
jgi:ribosome-binding protein aMBF1 (putative translation factor)